MLMLVEPSELFGAVLHHCWDCACQLAVNRPVARHQHLCAKRDPRDLCFVVVQPLKLYLKILGELDIRKHLGHLIDGVETALNFELVEDDFLGFARNRGLVQQAHRQELLVVLNKHITSVQAAEQSHDCIQTLLSLLICNTLETDCQLVVCKTSNINRSR